MRPIYILHMNIFSYWYVRYEYITNVPTTARETQTHFTYNNKMFLGALKKANNHGQLTERTIQRANIKENPR